MTRPVYRASATFGIAVAGSHASQLVWVIAGSRVLGIEAFGTVLAAQALYGVLQLIVDNGTAFHGARLAARESLSDGMRSAIVAARVRLAGSCALVGTTVALLGGPTLAQAFAPFVGALLLFSVLNVWEPYGNGRVAPYAAYLLCRSAFLAAVVLAAAAASAQPPVMFAGLVEIVVIVFVGVTFSALVRPVVRHHISGSTWKAVGAVGVPALISQASFASATIILGFAGQGQAAAVTGVGARLVTGIQGINGVLTAALFPTLARRRTTTPTEARSAHSIGIGIVAVSLIALGTGILCAAWLARVLLAESGTQVVHSLILWLAGGAASGYLMHVTMSMVARHAERGIAAATAVGLAVVVGASVVGAVVGSPAATMIAAAGFVTSQALGLALLARLAARVHDAERWYSRPATVLAALLAPAAGVLAIIDPFAGATLAFAGAAAAVFARHIVARQWTDVTDASVPTSAP